MAVSCIHRSKNESEAVQIEQFQECAEALDSSPRMPLSLFVAKFFVVVAFLSLCLDSRYFHLLTLTLALGAWCLEAFITTQLIPLPQLAIATQSAGPFICASRPYRWLVGIHLVGSLTPVA